MTVARALSILINAGMDEKEALASLREALLLSVGKNGNVGMLLNPQRVEQERLLSNDELVERYGPEGMKAVEILRR
jgi:hypothetical protein